MTDDKVCPRVDHRVGELDWITPVLPEGGLRARSDVDRVGAFGAHMHLDDDDLGHGGRFGDDLLRLVDVVERVAPGVRAEAGYRDLDARHVHHGYLTGRAGVPHTVLF